MKQELIKKALEQLRIFDKTDDIDDLERYTDTLIQIKKEFNIDGLKLNDLLNNVVYYEKKAEEAKNILNEFIG